MIYYISDLHFFCKSQTNEGSVNYDNRPFATVAEMHAHMHSVVNTKRSLLSKAFKSVSVLLTH